MAKIKMILPTKRVQQRGGNNYKDLNITAENINDPTMVNILSSSNTPTRANAPTATSN